MHVYVRVKTGAKREMVKKVSDGRFVIEVKEPARNNHANRRILEIIREIYTGDTVRMIKGHHALTKIFEIKSKQK